MTKQLDVILAVKALVALALPNAEIVGFEQDASRPTRIGPGGVVIGHPGEPGEPEIDLSPLTYTYSHRLYLEVAAPGGVAGATLDAMITEIGVHIAADRQLGGLCHWIEAVAPERNDRTTQAIATTNWAMIAIDAEYSTTDPLA